MNTAMHAAGGGGNLPGSDLVGNVCCDCWTHGCGLDGMYGGIADCLECAAGPLEYCADLIWCFGSPLAFPCVFCFGAEPENSQQPQGPGGGWHNSMLQAPTQSPGVCCFASLCPWCAQWWARRQALRGDMTQYKLWQGQHDGPQCLARRCPGAPITIKSGTYGEDKCPEGFLCLEVCILGGPYSLCCAHNVTRRVIRNDYQLGQDPTEIRVDKCVAFFGTIMRLCCRCALCLRICSCCVGCCAPDSDGAQECAGEGARAARACFQIGRILWRGIQSTRLIAMGCMVAQQHEHLTEFPDVPQAVEGMKMEGRDEKDDKEDDDPYKVDKDPYKAAEKDPYYNNNNVETKDVYIPGANNNSNTNDGGGDNWLTGLKMEPHDNNDNFNNNNNSPPSSSRDRGLPTMDSTDDDDNNDNPSPKSSKKKKKKKKKKKQEERQQQEEFFEEE